MKKFIFLFMLIPVFCFSQQNIQTVYKSSSGKTDYTNFTTVQKTKDSLKKKIPVFSIFGVANLNKQTLKSFNAGGKASLAARPYIDAKNSNGKLSVEALAFYASFNKSASNNDSVVHAKLIFPELASSSFIGTLQWEMYRFYPNGKTHTGTFFLELGVKSIQTDTSEKGQKIFFDALNYTTGFKYGFNYQLDNPFDSGKTLNLGFYVAPFISAFNIPDEDRQDYLHIMLKNATITGNKNELSDLIFNLGIKTGFLFNGMEFFADLRHVLGKNKVPIKELRGFHANIGFVFNADILNI